MYEYGAFIDLFATF